MHYKLIAFIVAAGVAAVLVRGYKFGVGNQVEQIPLILRVLDRDYLPTDFMVNSTSDYNPRWYFSRTMAGFARVAGLPAAFLVTTLIANIGVLAATALMAGLAGGNKKGVVGAVIMVAAFESVGIGGDTSVVSGVLSPQILAMPLALWSVTLAWRNKLALGAIVAGVSGLIHPQVGIYVGALAILTQLMVARDWRRGAVGMGILGLFALVWLPLARMTGSQPLAEFVQIYVYWRNPHHYAPSTWDKQMFVEAGWFLLAMGVAVWQAKRIRKQVWTMVGWCLLLFGCGYVFVEVWPVRWIIILQLWRLVFVVKWLGLVLAGVVVASRLRWVWLVPLAIGPRFDLREWGLVGVLVTIWWMLSWRRGWVAALAVVVGIGTTDKFRPQWRWDLLKGDEYDVARHVNKNSLVLAPINFSQVRFLAPAPLVVDWKPDPYTDEARIEWHRRIGEIYGENISEFGQIYKEIDDTKLLRLAREYGFGQAILFAQTRSSFGVVYRNSTYQIVKVF